MTCHFCCSFFRNAWSPLLAGGVLNHCFCLSTVKEPGYSAMSSAISIGFNWKLEDRAICLSASEFIWFKNKSWDGGQLPFHANRCHGFNLIILVLCKLLFICCSLFSSFSAWPLDAPKSICKLKGGGGGEGREMFIENSYEDFQNLPVLVMQF